MKKSDSPLHIKYLQTMVECLYILGKVAAAGAIIWFVIHLSHLLFSAQRKESLFFPLNLNILLLEPNKLYRVAACQI